MDGYEAAREELRRAELALMRQKYRVEIEPAEATAK